MAKWEKEKGPEVGSASGEGEVMGFSCKWGAERLSRLWSVANVLGFTC